MKETYIVVCPNGETYAGEIGLDGMANLSSVRMGIKQLCKDALDRFNYKGSRVNPQELQCKIEKLVVHEGEIKQIHWDNIDVMPELLSMTQAEFQTELGAALKKIPVAFRNFVDSWAYEHGHSAGYEEVLSIAENLIAELRPAIHSYDLASH